MREGKINRSIEIKYALKTERANERERERREGERDRE